MKNLNLAVGVTCGAFVLVIVAMLSQVRSPTSNSPVPLVKTAPVSAARARGPLDAWLVRDAALRREPRDGAQTVRLLRKDQPFHYSHWAAGWAQAADESGWVPLHDLSAERPLTAMEQRAARKAARDAQKLANIQGAAERMAFAESARNGLLDGGFDMQVTVSGKNSDRLTFTYVLANAVWQRKLATSGIIDGLRKKGFRRVDLENGYDFHVYWTFG